MRAVRAFLAVFALAVLTSACSFIGSRLHPAPTPSPTPDTLVSKLGTSVSLQRALRTISFRPYIPSRRQLVDVALISPLTGADTPKTIGIAFEYASGGQAMVLQEWPLAGARPALDAGPLSASPCVLTPFKSDGVLWTTPGRLMMALQADGKIKPSRISSEARRLMGHGGCR